MHDLHAFLPTQLKNDFSPGSSSPFEKRDLYAFVPAQLINDFSPGSSSALENDEKTNDESTVFQHLERIPSSSMGVQKNTPWQKIVD